MNRDTEPSPEKKSPLGEAESALRASFSPPFDLKPAETPVEAPAPEDAVLRPQSSLTHAASQGQGGGESRKRHRGRKRQANQEPARPPESSPALTPILLDMSVPPPKPAEIAGAGPDAPSATLSGPDSALCPECSPEASVSEASVSEWSEAAPLPSLESPHPFPVESGEISLSPAPVIPRMYIVMVTPEIAPAAKVGGIADVVAGLSQELAMRGNTVEIILPKYDCMRYDQIKDLGICYQDLWVPWNGGFIHSSVWSGEVLGRRCYFIDPHSAENFYNRRCIYGNNDDVIRFAFLCRAALEFMLKTGKNPEIIHCHDWQTSLLPVLLFEIYKNAGMPHPRVCLTVHNFKHQGSSGDGLLWASGLGRPEYFHSPERLRDNGNPRALNLLKGGLVYSNFITTVSPQYAWEAKENGQGNGLEPTLHTHHMKYGGIVNGIDFDYWDPKNDMHIPGHYSAESLDGKYLNKAALRKRFMLADGVKPIISFVGRLDPQKGIDLVRHGLFHAIRHNAQFVLLGTSPNAGINGAFWNLKRSINDNPDSHIELSFNEELAHLIYAGSDMILVPSLFEPCGLTQLIALRYGTVPIVRRVGGLADTVVDKDYSDKPLKERNGYVFNDANAGAVSWAMERAISCYYAYPDDFRKLIQNGMRCDYSWKSPAEHYLRIYDYIRDK